MTDILHEILSRLPAKCVIRFRTVSKTWKLVIDGEFLAKSHTKMQHSNASSTILIKNGVSGGLHMLSLDRLIFADGTQKIDGITSLKQIIHRGVPRLGKFPVSMCNGLILITQYHDNKNWVIWNPLVEDFHVVPPPPASLTGSRRTRRLSTRSVYIMSSCGIGYDEVSDDYKIVRTGWSTDKAVLGTSLEYKTLVYTLKSRRWRAIEGFPSKACLESGGVYLNGALYWRSRDAIIAFDVGKETHVRLPRPPHPYVDGSFQWESLDALDGCLIFSCGHLGRMGIQGWVMDECGSSWTRLFSVRSNEVGSLKLVAYLKTQAQVFFQRSSDRSKCGLVWLDLQAKSAKYAVIAGLPNDQLTFSQFNAFNILRLDYTKSGSSAPLKRLQARSELVFSLERASL